MIATQSNFIYTRFSQYYVVLAREPASFWRENVVAVVNPLRVLARAQSVVVAILGDPGADSGDEEKSKRAGKYMARRKVKNGEKSPWGQCLTRPVPNGRRRSGF